MFLPNVNCEFAKVRGFDAFGEIEHSTWKKARCGIVRLELETSRTSVRTDSSGSKGGALEDDVTSRLLFPAGVSLAANDKVRIKIGRETFTLTVTSIFPRHAISGRLDHWQVDLQIYQADM